MIVKKYQAQTEEAAMEAAKSELGKDAIVMNIKTIRPRGIYKLFKKLTVEVTAAVDDNNSSNPSVVQQEMAGNVFASDRTAALASAPVQNTAREYAIERKLNALQELLEKQMAAGKAMTPEKQVLAGEEKKLREPEERLETDDLAVSAQDVKNEAASKRNACIQLIYDQLVQNEVDAKYADQIISEIESSLKKDASVDNILGAVYQKIILKLGQPVELQLNTDKTKYIFFIGPTGVGKTTTIAKLASELKLEKKMSVALLTADTYRIAAVEQLRTYANILNIPLRVVYSAGELTEAKGEFSSYDLVLVDTAGRSHKSREQFEDVKRLIEMIAPEEREIYLVLSTTTKYRDLIRITETYQELSGFRLIFTKLDETGSLGNILNIRMLIDAPLSYHTWGQNVPDDIGIVDVQKIAKQLLGGGE